MKATSQSGAVSETSFANLCLEIVSLAMAAKLAVLALVASLLTTHHVVVSHLMQPCVVMLMKCAPQSRTIGAAGGPEANVEGLDVVDDIGFDVGYRFAER
jgi:hypothetical protein